MPVEVDLIAPVSKDDFLRDHWGKKLLHVARAGQPDWFDNVVTLVELDRITTSTRIPATNFNLAIDDNPLPLDSYCVGGDYVDKQRAFQLHKQGATIILRSVEQWCPRLNCLRANVEDWLGHEVQINVYITPRSMKSTPPHWDTHELFILQIAGKKRWRMFWGHKTNPLHDERFQVGIDAADYVDRDIILSVGDTFYLPRGMIHEPVAEDYSIHVSVGVHVPQKLDIAQAALRICALREGSVLRHMEQGELTVVDVASTLDDQALAEARVELCQRFLVNRAFDLEGALVEAIEGPSLAPETRYQWRAGVVPQTSNRDGKIVITFRSGVVTLSNSFASLVRRVVERQEFSPIDLASDGTTEQPLALCIALWEAGFLRRLR